MGRERFRENKGRESWILAELACTRSHSLFFKPTHPISFLGLGQPNDWWTSKENHRQSGSLPEEGVALSKIFLLTSFRLYNCVWPTTTACSTASIGTAACYILAGDSIGQLGVF